MTEVPIAVVMPVRDAEETIGEALRSIYSSTVRPAEVVVVDDSSTDRSLETAREFPVRIVRSEPPGGVAAARNTGAALTRQPILFFVDADVVLDPKAIAAAAATLSDPAVSAAIGLQSARAVYANAATLYKNYWLHYTYERRAARVEVLYSSAVAIRREPFDRVGGFDPNYRSPNIEDSDLGKRITDAGYRLAVVPEMSFLHAKRYSVGGIARTDFRRTVGMTKVQLRDRFRRMLRGNYSSIPTSFLVSCLVPWIAAGLFLAGPRVAGLLAPLVIVLLNQNWLRSLARAQGSRAAAAGLFFLHLDVLAVNAGIVWGSLEYLFGRKY